MRRSLLVLLATSVAALLLVLGSPAIGQTTDEGSDEETVSNAVDELQSEIQVLDVDQDDGAVTLIVAVPLSIGQLAPTADNFGIVDGGQLMDFEVRPVTNAVDTIIVIDTSDSMRGAPLEAAKRAASTFIDQLPERSRVGVVGFGETVTIHHEPSEDRAAARDAVASLATSGETALWDGLVTAADLVAESDEPFVVVLSDGENTVGTATQDDATARLRSVDATLYAVGIESSETDLVALEASVDAVGGQYFDTTDLTELEALYADIAGRLANRYELVYDTSREDNREVRVSVAVGDSALATATATVGAGGRVEDSLGDTGETPRTINIPDDARLGIVPSPSPGMVGGANGLWIGAGLLFLAFAVIGTLMTLPSTHVRLDAATGADRVAGVGGRVTGVADRLIANRDSEGTLDKALDAAGLNLRAGEYLVICAAAVVGVSLLFAAVGGAIVGVILGAAAGLAAMAYLSIRAGRRRTQFADQLVDTLGIMIGSLRAGRGLPQAIELVSQEAPTPTSEQFQRVIFETRVGRDMTRSLLDVADRMHNRDFEWVARAIDINRELGGNLTETLANVADTIRDRRRVARQVQALSAEGRASGWVMLALPFVMYLFTLWRTPDSALLLFTHPVGRILLGIGMVGMVIGYFWIRRLVNLKY
jgi:tight adherence protein B